MNPLDNVVVAMVSGGAAWAEACAAALRAAGASVRVCSPEIDMWAALSGGQTDAVVLADMAGPIGVARVAEMLADEPRTARLPKLLLVGPDESTPGKVFLKTGMTVVSAAADARVLVAAVADLAQLPPRSRSDDEYASGPRLNALRKQIQATSHDTRALLGIIVGFACNLRDGVAGPVTDAQRDHVRRILDAASDATNLLERATAPVSDVPPPSSSLGAESLGAKGRRENQRTHVDLARIVTAVGGLFEEVALERGIAVRIRGDEPAIVWADAMQVKQVVTNLVSNAIKFTPRGGRIEIVARKAKPEGASGSDLREQCEIVVQDSGPGVPEPSREKIFEYGTRLVDDAGIPGSGVGLYVVKSLVGLHRGSVKVDQGDLGGARFAVTLPIDLRSRARSNVLVVREGEEVLRLIEMLAQEDGVTARPLLPQDDWQKLLAQCEALLVVPGDEREDTALSRALDRLRRQLP